MRESKFERYKRQYLQKKGMETLNSLEDLIGLLVAGNREPAQRIINPTQLQYMQTSAKYKAYMGPAGVAKTTTGCADVLLRALMLPGSKGFIARRDYNDLKGTTLDTFNEMMMYLPDGTILDRIKEPPMRVIIRPMQFTGMDAVKPSEITFLGLSDNVGSYPFNFGFIDEADEVEEKYVEQLKARLRYKPYPDYPDDTGYMMGLAFNPPPKTHWLYTACTGLDANDEPIPGKTPWLKLFRPQKRENVQNLRAGYYDDMDSMPEELRMRLRDGEWGSTYPGAPVIREFVHKLHRNDEVKYAGGTLFRFWDFGYNRPYVCLANVSKKGHVEVFAEVLGFKQEIHEFISTVGKLCDEHARNAERIVDYGDPAVAQHKDTGNALSILNQAGINVRYQRTPFDLSLSTLRTRFGQLIDGRPGVQINGKNCPVLAGALEGGYCFKEDGVTPRKDGYYDHPVDALRYGIWNLFGASLTAINHEELPDNVARRSPRA
jgi:hypothetical protein